MNLSYDNDIIRRVLAGETRRYGVLVDRYKDQALTLAVRMVQNRALAEELVQDAFLKAFDALSTFRGDARFSTWLYRIVANLCLTRIARRRDFMEPLDGSGDLADGAMPLAPPGESLLDRLASDEIVALLGRELDALPDKYRVTLTLFYLDEMRYEDVAEVLGVPPGTVKTLLFRGRALLRERMTLLLGHETRVAS